MRSSRRFFGGLRVRLEIGCVSGAWCPRYWHEPAPRSLLMLRGPHGRTTHIKGHMASNQSPDYCLTKGAYGLYQILPEVSADCADHVDFFHEQAGRSFVASVCPRPLEELFGVQERAPTGFESTNKWHHIALILQEVIEFCWQGWARKRSISTYWASSPKFSGKLYRYQVQVYSIRCCGWMLCIMHQTLDVMDEMCPQYLGSKQFWIWAVPLCFPENCHSICNCNCYHR